MQSRLDRIAADWGVIPELPCRIKLLKVPSYSTSFYDFDEYERLVTAAAVDPDGHVAALLGGEAGLRCGEMLALEWRDVHLARRQICVQRRDF